MKYVLLFGSTADDETHLPPGDQPEVMERVWAWFAEHSAAGTILGGERLAAGITATTIRMSGSGQPELTDGPFIESKEEVSGFAIVEVADLDAALALARTWPALDIPGELVEVRPLYEM